MFIIQKRIDHLTDVQKQTQNSKCVSKKVINNISFLKVFMMEGGDWERNLILIQKWKQEIILFPSEFFAMEIKVQFSGLRYQ